MTIRVRVRHDRQIICPIRFTRAATGAPVADAPEVDDRGFAMGTRPGTWGQTNTRGAMVSIAEGDIVRVRLLREDIDDTAPLFLTSTDVQCVEVIEPVGGGPLPADGIFRIRGVRDYANRPVSIQVHLGDADGPVLGELEPHIFSMRNLRLIAHLVTIDGVATNRTAATLVNSFEVVNRIWRPYGIQFIYNAAQTRIENINGFENPGQITTHMASTDPARTGTSQDWAEFSTVINTRPVANHINYYFVHDMTGAFGLTFANHIARPNGYGCASRDNATDNSIAHELCHYLDNPNHAQQAIPPGAAHQDMWARRRLMWTPSPYAATGIAHRDNIGYGNTTRGAFITVKELPATVDQTDNELARARRRALNPY